MRHKHMRNSYFNLWIRGNYKKIIILLAFFDTFVAEL